MEDQVPFKVFTFWSDNGKPEVRRFGVEKTLVTSFLYMNAKLQEIYPGLKGKSYSVAWKDEEGDDVTVSSDEEVMTALMSMQGDQCVKLYIYVKNGDSNENIVDIFINASLPSANAKPSANVAGPSAGTAPSSNVHYGVMCDSCDSAIAGFRYKCTTCSDFDLCGKCEGSGAHPEHCMVRVPTPTMPHAVIKAAIKRSRHFLKTVAIAGQECPYKKNKREKSAERKHRADHDRHYRRPRSSWLDTFTTYMNEFANLAGDVDLEHKATNAQTQEQKNDAGAENKPESATATEPPQECRFIPQMKVEIFEQIIKAYMDGKFNDAAVNTNEVVTNNVSQNTDNVEMGQGDGSSETDKVSVKSESTSSESKRDDSPDKGDGWTMINKEKDLMDAYGKASAPEPSAPIGFNLPQEFQDNLKITERQSLYPPLNTATAVMNPKEASSSFPPLQTPMQPQPAPVQPQAAPAKPKPAPATAQTSRPQPQPRQRHHPSAHIDAAIQQMLNMGFTNEGGWLIQLLESKDGNIAAVLDLLTPVAPKK